MMRKEKLETSDSKLQLSEKRLEEVRKNGDEMTNEANQQSALTAFMGQILGMMIWKTSQAESVIDIFINKVRFLI